MMTTATHNAHDTTPAVVLFMAFELRENTWKLGFLPLLGSALAEMQGPIDFIEGMGWLTSRRVTHIRSP
jgi:hypothetical protein